MRRVSISAMVLAGALALGGSAWGQALGGGAYAGPSFGWFPQPSGFYTTATVPGMGRGGPSVMLYFPTDGSSAPGSVAGVQYRVPGTGGSVYLPGSTVGAGSPMAGVAGGGLGLPNPPRPARPAAAPATNRPAATKKAAAKTDAAKGKAKAKADAEEPVDAPPPRSTLRERRGIR